MHKDIAKLRKEILNTLKDIKKEKKAKPQLDYETIINNKIPSLLIYVDRNIEDGDMKVVLNFYIDALKEIFFVKNSNRFREFYALFMSLIKDNILHSTNMMHVFQDVYDATVVNIPMTNNKVLNKRNILFYYYYELITQENYRGDIRDFVLKQLAIPNNEIIFNTEENSNPIESRSVSESSPMNFAPTSPAYSPTSPAYSPTSPSYSPTSTSSSSGTSSRSRSSTSSSTRSRSSRTSTSSSTRSRRSRTSSSSPGFPVSPIRNISTPPRNNINISTPPRITRRRNISRNGSRRFTRSR